MTSNKRGKEGDMNKKEVIAERQLAHILIEIYPYDERSNGLSHNIYRIMEWHKEELEKAKDEAYNLGYERGSFDNRRFGESIMTKMKILIIGYVVILVAIITITISEIKKG